MGALDMMMLERDQLLSLSDVQLLACCRIDSFRGSGPGGQHRNTTDTAVRLTLLAVHTPITASACESRSQQHNRLAALHRLRLQIAYLWRLDTPPAWSGSWKLNAQRHKEYAQLVAQVLDALEQNDYGVAAAAAALGRSTGQLIRFCSRDPQLWSWINNQRQQRNLHKLKLAP